MGLNNKILLSGIFIFGITAGTSTVSSAEARRDVASSKGVQITIDVSPPDRLLIQGRIQVNINEVKIAYPNVPIELSLPIVNLGNHRLWEPFRPYIDPFFEPPMQPAMYYPFDVTQETPFGSFDYFGGMGHNYAMPGEAKILPPLAAPPSFFLPGQQVFIEIPSMGILSEGILPEGSIEKIGKYKYHVNFDTCEMGIPGDQCGVIDFIVRPNGVHTSKFTGVREDFFTSGRPEKIPHKKLRYRGKFTERSAKVKGSVFGTEIFPGVSGIINEYKLYNVTKYFNADN